jgi:phenolic acid decarboxylase
MLLIALAVVRCSTSSPLAPRNDAAPSFVGNRYTFHFNSGLQVEAYYASNKELQWKALSGPSVGTSGTENIYAITLAPNQYFISWVESNGTTVSNVLNLSTMKVVAFVTFPSGASRQAMTDEGTIHEIAAR